MMILVGKRIHSCFTLFCLYCMVCVLRSLALILFYELCLGLLLDRLMGSGFRSGMSLKIKL